MKHKTIYTYTLLDEMMASPTELLSQERRSYQLDRMKAGLKSIEMGESPVSYDWRVCSDAVNIMETLVEHGVWKDCDGDDVQVSDADRLIPDAIHALAMAGRRSLDGGHIRLDGPGIKAIRAILEDYETMLNSLSARSIIRAHRLTERRVQEILRGRGRKTDVTVMAL
jgi:hypothetical protein